MNPKCAAAVLLFLSTVPSFAQTDHSDALCEQYLKIPLPAEAQAVAQPKKWPDCDSYKSYSGIGRTVDYEAARKCAWRERLAQQADLEPRFTISSVFGGSAMLTVLYANGEGVERNIGLAERFACEAKGAPAEIAIRLKDLESRANSPVQKPTFDFCDDITSGFMQGFCAAYSSELRDQDRVKTLTQLLARMPSPNRQVFSELVRAQQAYARAHGSGEIDTSGTARAMYEIDAEDTLRDDFFAAIELFEDRNGFPRGTSADYRVADIKLNSIYKSVLSDAEAHKNEYGAVQPEGIRSAERAWLRYRDLFVKFAQQRYPDVSADAWLTLLTRDRIAVLDGSFCDMDSVEGKCAWQGDTWKPSPLP